MPMKYPLYRLYAFPDRLFGVSPAALVLLGAWLPDAALAAICCAS